MPAACSSSARLSTRKASTIMSWVAEAVATRSAASATTNGALLGLQDASNTTATPSISWVRTSQARRLPTHLVRMGTSSASTAGDQNTLVQYGVPTNANRPMVLMSTPLSVSQACKV